MRILVLAAALAAGLSTAGCAALGGSDVGKQVLTNLQGCSRHYAGSLGVGVTGSFQIDCAASAPAPAATPAGSLLQIPVAGVPAAAVMPPAVSLPIPVTATP